MGFYDNIRKLVTTTTDVKIQGQTSYRTYQVQNSQQIVEGVVKSVAGTVITVDVDGTDRIGYATFRQVQVGSRVTLFGGRVF